MAFALFAVVIALLLIGYPVAFTLAGTSIIFILISILTGDLNWEFLQLINNRLYGIMTNTTLMAIPLFVFMGVTLQHCNIAENLLIELSRLLTYLRSNLSVAVVLVGMLLAASTGIVGATVVTLGLLALPVMLKHGYDPKLACGTICASGTLGQIIPPSIVLILLGDVISSAYQKAQLDQGIFSPESVSVVDLFAGAIIPGLVLVGLYITYLTIIPLFKSQLLPPPPKQSGGLQFKKLCQSLAAPLFLIVAVLGTILTGVATPTEASSVGAIGTLLLSTLNQTLSLERLRTIVRSSARITAMVFMILIGASFFSLAFRSFGGDEIVHRLLTQLPGGVFNAVLMTMLIMFLLGFILDFIEITLIAVPIVAPPLLLMGVDPIWLGVMIALNLQTSFLTPPFGFSLFYLRGVAPNSISTKQIYAGVTPFIAIQLLMLCLLALFPMLATWLPKFLSL